MTTPLEAARAQARHVDPQEAAARCGFAYAGTPEAGTFRATLLGQRIELEFPSFEGRFTATGRQTAEHAAALLAYYVATSDGTPPTGSWIAFSDLPDGRFYCSTWRGYTGRVLARHFGNDVAGVLRAGESLGGTDVDLPGDARIGFRVLPHVPVALAYWSGDDEFEARADFLFDATAGHHLPTDAYAVLCKWLTDTLVDAGPPSE